MFVKTVNDEESEIFSSLKDTSSGVDETQNTNTCVCQRETNQTCMVVCTKLGV